MGKITQKKHSSKQRRLINFLIPGAVTHRLIQFDCSGQEIKGTPKSQECTIHKKFQEDWCIKDFRNLFYKKINVSWASLEDVFLRVMHLPGENPNELKMMVELQLEKISPIPLAQLVWDIQILPNPVPLPLPEPDPEHPEEEVNPMYLYSVVVLLAEKTAIENFLVFLEESGFYADRLELPFLHEALKSPDTKDGLYVYPMSSGSKDIAITVWWTQGQLQNIDIIYLPQEDVWKKVFTIHLNQIIWAAQVAGWLKEDFKWTLEVPAEDDEPISINEWKMLMTELYGEGEIHERMMKSELARFNCTLICSVPTANLLPIEFVSVYRQKYIDRLWLQGIVAVVLFYIAFCIIYFSGSSVANFQKSRIETRLALLENDYKTALKLREQVDLLQLQHTLKFAALDCYRLTAELLPTDLKLTRMNFNGDSLSFVGEAPSDKIALVTAFNEQLQRAVTYGENPTLFFKRVDPPTSVQKAGAGNTLTWRFSCELNLPELNTK